MTLAITRFAGMPAQPPAQALGPRDSAADSLLWPEGKPEWVTDPPQPVARFSRPVLLIPGGKSIEYGLPDILHYLTAGATILSAAPTA